MISFIYSRFLRTDLLMLVLPVLLISFNNEMAVKLRKEFLPDKFSYLW
jgi:predicted membrane-bound mannosyltransferase